LLPLVEIESNINDLASLFAEQDNEREPKVQTGKNTFLFSGIPKKGYQLVHSKNLSVKTMDKQTQKSVGKQFTTRRLASTACMKLYMKMAND
jgi:hypothetical protein